MTNYYSLRRLLTGLANAALKALYPTVSQPINNDVAIAAINTNTPGEMR